VSVNKDWPQKELDGLAALEVNGRKVILPIWHNVTKEEVAQYSPTLADRLAVRTAERGRLNNRRHLQVTFTECRSSIACAPRIAEM
jgi:hypothetical protein